MKLSKMLFKTEKTTPADCQIESHKLTLRGSYIKYMHNGVFTLYPIAKRITRKIENIIREEMDAIDGQEVMFPVVMNASLWEESGRFSSVGSELVRFKDRSNNDLVLGMTHEEAAVHLARNTAQSYTQFPFMIYQIQTKFRDEPRARGGLIRVREFTMKDAYSFHTSQADLEEYYKKAHLAYERIFKRVGAKNFVSVKSDSGMMGGSVSHEFMLISEIGEDTIAVCDTCDYKANLEVASVIVNNEQEPAQEMQKVYTPDTKTIEEVTTFLNADVTKSIKAVVYQRNIDDSYVVAFVRGDREVNETKLKNAVGEELHVAEITEDCGIIEGFIGPIGLPENVTILFDQTIKGGVNMVIGANEKDYHIKGVSVERDLKVDKFVDVCSTQTGDICPICGKPSLKVNNSIEIGNIFQLGTKYTKSMNMTYQDENGQDQYPIMGCYGIGVGRLLASICEESHDDYGPIWPMSIAPWQVQICSIRPDVEQVKIVADKLYEDLKANGVEVLYDDRDARPGFKFADADLFGVPIRIVLGPKNLESGELEVSFRDKSFKGTVKLENVVEEIKNMVASEMAKYNA